MGDIETGGGPELDELELLVDALGVEPSSVQLVSREPLGEGSVSGYDVTEPGEGEGGDSTLRYYVDTSRLRVKQETGLAMGDPASPDARTWLHPADPHLAALAPIAFHEASASLLSRFGVTAAGAPEFVGYRPGRRAVLFVDASDRRVWVKVVRKSRVERIYETHTACEQAGLPVPSVLGWSPEGVILLENAAGTPAADIAWDPEALLDCVDDLRDQIARVETPHRARGVADRLDWYAGQLSARGEIAGVDAVVENVRSVLESGRQARSPRVVHGDLHFGQLFLRDGRISGVIDVDTLGTGDAAEDPAAFIAHATMSALITSPETRERVWALADAATERWGEDRTVRALFAVHMLGHSLAASGRGEDAQVSALLKIASRVLAGGKPS